MKWRASSVATCDLNSAPMSWNSQFLLSFSQPNFYFHATTAYDILRARGVPLGKRDFMGPLRLKT